jgi:hypothetical protein
MTAFSEESSCCKSAIGAGTVCSWQRNVLILNIKFSLLGPRILHPESLAVASSRAKVPGQIQLSQ